MFFGSCARGVAITDEEVITTYEFIDMVERGWGSGDVLRAMCPSVPDNDDTRSLFACFERQSASPVAVGALIDLALKFDVRPLLPAITAPTLVIHRTNDPVVPSYFGRERAGGIRGARFIEIDGNDHPPYFGDAATTDERYSGAPRPASPGMVCRPRPRRPVMLLRWQAGR